MKRLACAVVIPCCARAAAAGKPRPDTVLTPLELEWTLSHVPRLRAASSQQLTATTIAQQMMQLTVGRNRVSAGHNLQLRGPPCQQVAASSPTVSRSLKHAS